MDNDYYDPYEMMEHIYISWVQETIRKENEKNRKKHHFEKEDELFKV